MFVALYPPQPVVAELVASLSAVKHELGGSEAVRWSQPSQWHLTMAFMAKVPEDRVPALSAALSEAARENVAAPTLQVAGAGQFGATTLWWSLRLDEVAERWLVQLARRLRRGCRQVGAAPDDSRLRPHVTLGRVRRDAPPGTARRWSAALGSVTSRAWVPRELVLVTSVTGPVVDHTVTGRWPLTG